MAGTPRIARSQAATVMLGLIAVLSLTVGGSASAQKLSPGTVLSPPYAANGSVANLRFNDTYYAQIHNAYAHGRSLTAWLSAGYRTVELDVIDSGEWYTNPDGPIVSHASTPDLTNCGLVHEGGIPTARLGRCLAEIRDWRAEHDSAVPLVIFVDMKTTGIDVLTVWDAIKVANLDRYIRNWFTSDWPGALYSYVDARARVGGNSDSDVRALFRNRADAWPVNGEIRNRVMVALTGGKYGSVNQHMANAYHHVGGNPSTFLCPDVDAGDPGEIDGKIDGMNELDSTKFLCTNIQAGKHMETSLNRAYAGRQMIHTWGASGSFASTGYGYNFMVVAQGASVIGWDSDLSLTGGTWVPGWRDSIPLVGGRRSLPGYFEMINVTSGQCTDVETSKYTNGTKVNNHPCNGTGAQSWVYTAEGQLRPKGNNVYCMDVAGGQAAANKQVHIWDCDGGASEKWAVDESGRFHNSTQDHGYCLDSEVNTYRTHGCADHPDQKFRLRAVADWAPTDYRQGEKRNGPKPGIGARSVMSPAEE